MPIKRPGAFYEDMVDAINEVYGAHKGFRAAHAKGQYVKGTFTPTDSAERLSRAPHFRGAPTPISGRFSNGSGLPTAADLDPDARGLAVKFHLPDGSSTDLVAITIPAFFVRTPEDFVAFTRARRPDPSTGQPDRARVGAFVAAHPETQTALAMLGKQPPPTSFAGSVYNGIHSFVLTNSEGVSVHARYRLQPVKGGAAAPITGGAGPQAFQEDLRRQLASGPVRFDLHYVLAQPGDLVDDPTVPWPVDRLSVVAGRLEFTEAVEMPADVPDDKIFDPVNVVDGIACSEDEILHARSGAYSVSYARRTARP